MNYVNRSIVAPADLIGAVRALAGVFPGTGGDRFLPVALSASGESPASHFCAEGMVGVEFAAILPLTHVDAETGAVSVDAVDAGPLAEMAAEAGSDVSVEQVAELLGACVVSEGPLAETLERLGLRFVTEVEPL